MVFVLHIGAMSCINAQTGVKFIVIIDEWDVLIRDEAANEADFAGLYQIFCVECSRAANLLSLLH